jgi:hypothetical protein
MRTAISQKAKDLVDGCIKSLKQSVNGSFVQDQTVDPSANFERLLRAHERAAEGSEPVEGEPIIPEILVGFLVAIKGGQLKADFEAAKAWLKEDEEMSAVSGGEADLEYLGVALVLIVNLFPVNGEHALGRADLKGIAASMNPGELAAYLYLLFTCSH